MYHKFVIKNKNIFSINYDNTAEFHLTDYGTGIVCKPCSSKRKMPRREIFALNEFSTCLLTNVYLMSTILQHHSPRFRCIRVRLKIEASKQKIHTFSLH